MNNQISLDDSLGHVVSKYSKLATAGLILATTISSNSFNVTNLESNLGYKPIRQERVITKEIDGVIFLETYDIDLERDSPAESIIYQNYPRW